MSAATELWAAVVASYDEDGLITLTNIRDRAASTINTAVGEDAAQEVVNLWPLYSQEVYDEDNDQHVTVGKRACIAVLWQRGGSAAGIAKVEWDEVFGDNGTISRVRKTGPRGRQGPSSNSGVQTRSELSNGRPVQGWSDRGSLPHGILPSRRLARE